MRVRRKSPKKEKAAMSISLYGNLFFVIVEWVMAILTGSQAVLLDGVYDGIEFVMLLPSIFLIPLLYKPANEKHPYGYMQWETIFLGIKGFTMSAVSIGLISNNIQFMIHGGRPVSFDIVAYFELFAAIVGLIVYLLLRRKNRKLYSPIIHTEMVGWKIDFILSFGMTLAFFLPKWITVSWFRPFVPYLDPLITVILSMIMLPEPIKTVINAFRDLLLMPPEDDIVQDIKDKTHPFIDGIPSLDVGYDIVRTGRRLWISVYVTFPKDEISLRKLNEIQTRCIDELKKTYADFYFEILPQLTYEPTESVESAEVAETAETVPEEVPEESGSGMEMHS